MKVIRNIDWGEQFQTPDHVCEYMASFIPAGFKGSILEPTAGKGNLVRHLESKGDVLACRDFFGLEFRRFDYIVMNPPFSPMVVGYVG